MQKLWATNKSSVNGNYYYLYKRDEVQKKMEVRNEGSIGCFILSFVHLKNYDESNDVYLFSLGELIF